MRSMLPRVIMNAVVGVLTTRWRGIVVHIDGTVPEWRMACRGLWRRASAALATISRRRVRG